MMRHESPLLLLQTLAEANYGWQHSQHSYTFILMALAYLVKPVVALEIGSRRGASALMIAKALEDNDNGGILHCVDPFIKAYGGGPEQAEEFIRNIKHAGLSHRIDLHIKTSAEAAEEIPEKLDFAFFDGDLSEQSLRSDLNTYAVRVRVGGVVAVHDTRSEPGVLPALEKSAYIINAFIPFLLNDDLGMWYGIRVA
jgi:predicted O-methyltransferase YrrM